MKTKFTYLLMVVLLLAFGLVDNSLAQTAITATTFSAAVTNSATRVAVASATGFTASSGTVTYVLFADREAMRITAVSGTTISVERGWGQTVQTAHISGAAVYVGRAGAANADGSGGPFVGNSPAGACTRANVLTLPLINIANGKMYNCFSNGQWYEQTLPDSVLDITPSTVAKYCTVPIGQVAYGSVGTDAVSVAGSVYVASLWVPESFLSTGATLLNGTTAGTDKLIYVLYDAGGAKLANTAVAGTTASGTDAFQGIAWTAPQVVTGPARYFLGLQVNGTTTKKRTVATVTNTTLVGNSRTGTFGTLPAITVPTSLTADTAVVGCLY